MFSDTLKIETLPFEKKRQDDRDTMPDQLLHKIYTLLHQLYSHMDDPSCTPRKLHFLESSTQVLEDWRDQILEKLSPPIEAHPGMYVTLEESAKTNIKQTIARIQATTSVYFQ